MHFLPILTILLGVSSARSSFHHRHPTKNSNTISRGPCPALNVLANTGGLPYSGQNITIPSLIVAIHNVYNIHPAFAEALVTQAFKGLDFVNAIGDDDGSGPILLSLSALNSHNLLEYDASLVRFDHHLAPQPKLVAALLNDSSNSQYLTEESLARSRARRDSESQAAGSPPLTDTQMKIAYSKAAMLLQVLGQQQTVKGAAATSDDNEAVGVGEYIANKTSAQTWLLSEIFPDKWLPPKNQITFASTVALAAHIAQYNNVSLGDPIFVADFPIALDPENPIIPIAAGSASPPVVALPDNPIVLPDVGPPLATPDSPIFIAPAAAPLLTVTTPIASTPLTLPDDPVFLDQDAALVIATAPIIGAPLALPDDPIFLDQIANLPLTIASPISSLGTPLALPNDAAVFAPVAIPTAVANPNFVNPNLVIPNLVIPNVASPNFVTPMVAAEDAIVLPSPLTWPNVPLAVTPLTLPDTPIAVAPLSWPNAPGGAPALLVPQVVTTDTPLDMQDEAIYPTTAVNDSNDSTTITSVVTVPTTTTSIVTIPITTTSTIIVPPTTKISVVTAVPTSPVSADASSDDESF